MCDDAKLQLLLDRMEISDAVIRYATSIDMRDWAALRSCFADEVEVEVPAMRGRSEVMSADKWVERVRRGLSGLTSTQHMVSNHVITIYSDDATCLSYVRAIHYLPNDQGENAWTIGGYYVISLVRTGESWRIRKYKLTVTWTAGNPYVLELGRKRLAEAGNG